MHACTHIHKRSIGSRLCIPHKLDAGLACMVSAVMRVAQPRVGLAPAGCSCSRPVLSAFSHRTRNLHVKGICYDDHHVFKHRDGHDHGREGPLCIGFLDHSDLCTQKDGGVKLVWSPLACDRYTRCEEPKCSECWSVGRRAAELWCAVACAYR